MLGNFARISWAQCSLQVMALSNAVVEQRFVVTNNCMGKTFWSPSTREVQGEHFIQLDKWNRDFTKFVTGKALDLKRVNMSSINYQFFDDLVLLRNEASKEAVKEATMDDEGTSAVCKRRITHKDKDLAPPVVTITLPQVSFGSANFEATPIKVLWGVKSTELWVNLSDCILEHIRMGILESINNQGRASRKKTRGTSGDLENSESTETQTTTGGPD